MICDAGERKPALWWSYLALLVNVKTSLPQISLSRAGFAHVQPCPTNESGRWSDLDTVYFGISSRNRTQVEEACLTDKLRVKKLKETS